MERLGWPRTVAPMLAKDAAERTRGTLTTVSWDPKVFKWEKEGLGKMATGTGGQAGEVQTTSISQSHFSMNSGLLTPLKQYLKGSRGMGEGSGRAEDALPFFSYFFVSSAKQLKPAGPQQ